METIAAARLPRWFSLRDAAALPALRQVLTFMSSNMAVLAAQVVSSVLVARWAGPVFMGYLNSASVFLSYAPVLMLGINNGLNRQLPFLVGGGRREDVQVYADTALWWVRAAGIAATLALLGTALGAWYSGDVRAAETYAVFALIIPLTYRSTNIEVTFRTSGDFMALSRIKYANGFTAIVSAPLVWLLGWAGLLGRVLGIQLIYNGLLHRGRRIRARPRFSSAAFKTLVRVGLPIFLVSYLYTLFTVTDRTLILALLSKKEMGLYTPAIQLGAAFLVIPASVNMIVYPRMCETFGRTGRARDLAQLAYIPVLALGTVLLPLYAVAWWLVDPLVRIVLPSYVGGIAAARWMVVAAYFAALSTPQDVFTTVNRLPPYAAAIAVGILTNALLALLLVRRGMGLTGVGIGNAVGMAVIVCLSIGLSARYVFGSTAAPPRPPDRVIQAPEDGASSHESQAG